MTDKQLLALYRSFYRAWETCEAGRGCYSCCASHDARCGMSFRDDEAIACTCGRDAIERIAKELILNEPQL